MSGDRLYFGKFRGVVLNNVDPMQIGRLLVQVPDVSGLAPSSWAMPCVPVSGRQMGVFVVPQVGAGVWIEYEQGDSDHPVWVGGFWGSAAEVPALALAGVPASPSLVFQSARQNALVLSDLPGPAGGILLKSASGALISMNETGITISNGQGATITMNGPTITINQGALAIT